jgi:hypothetical protein
MIFYVIKNILIAGKVDVDIDSGSELHERVKAYARENGIRHPHAYRELIEKGLEADCNSKYPCLLAAFGDSLRQGLPASRTRFAGTTAVPAGSTVSTGRSEIEVFCTVES